MCFGLFCKSENEQIKSLQQRCDSLVATNADLNNKIKTVSDNAGKIIIDNANLTEANKKLSADNEVMRILAYMVVPPMPAFLDMSQDPYLPSIRVDSRGSIYHVSIRPQDIYCISPTLAKAVTDNNLKGSTDDITFRNIWRFVLNRIDYEYDVDESWEYPTTTYYRQHGDCEDGTILFNTLCRLCGISADKVFNAVGWYRASDGSLFGHSYPIVKLADGKWYIMETTLANWSDSLQAKLFMGSNYTADWGMANWIFSGKLKAGLQI